MKTYTALTVSALIVASTMNSASAMESYCKKLPNPDKCAKTWGHGEGTANNDFGKAYKTAGGVWSKLCKTELADIKMTAGAALGDPCCKWTGSPTEATQFPVSFTEASVCPAGAGGGATGDDTATTAPSTETNEKGSPPEAAGTNEKGVAPEAAGTNEKGVAPEAAGTNEKGVAPEATPSQDSYGDSPDEVKSDIAKITTSTGGADSPATPPAAGGCAAKGARKLRS